MNEFSKFKSITTFRNEKENIKRKNELLYYISVTNELITVFKNKKLIPVFSIQSQIKTLLGNTKDKELPKNYSGI